MQVLGAQGGGLSITGINVRRLNFTELDATKRDPGRRNGNLTSYFTFNKITTILQVHSF